MKNPYGYMSMANQAGNSKQNGGATNGGWGMTTGQDDTKAFSAQRSLMGPMDSANDFNGQTSFGQGAGGGQELSAQGAYGGRSGWAPPQSVNRSAYNAVAPQRTAAQQNRWNNRSGGNFSNSVPGNYYQGVPSSNGAQQFGMGGQDPLAGYGGNGNPAQSGAPMQNRNRMGGGGNGAPVMGAGGSIDGVMYSTDAAPPPGRGEPGAGVGAPPARGGAGSDPINNPYPGAPAQPQQGGGSSLLRPYSPYPNNGQYPAGDFFTGQDRKFWDDPSNQAAAQAFTNSMSPLYTIQEGGRQFNATELEGARRFDAEFGRTNRNDEWGQGFSERQQTEAERVAMEAENQWNKDFEWGKSQDMFGRGIATGELDLAKLTQAQRNALDTGQLTLAQLTQQQRNTLDTGQLALANRTQTENANVDRARLSLDAATQNQNNAIEKGQLALSQLTQQQRNAVEMGQLDLANLTQQQRNAIENAQLSFQQRQENNRYAIDKGQLSLADRTQQQAANVDRAKLSLDAMTQTQLNQYRNQQLAQEAALSRENMKNQMAMQTMQAFGRTQAPNVRFMRNWG